MSQKCRRCGEKMPEDRKGHEQVCPDCIREQAMHEAQMDSEHDDWGSRD